MSELFAEPRRRAQSMLLVGMLLLTACASIPSPATRVLVYNIHAGKDASGVDNLERVAALIDANDADIVLLQEVDRDTTRSGKVDQLATLMRLTKMHGVFGRSLDYQGGQYGIAILSRWPVSAHDTVPLHVDPPQPRAGGSVEPRVALFATIDAPGGTITVVNTHLDASREDSWRRQEIAQLRTAIAARTRGSMLIGGDFNATPDSAIYASLTAAHLTDVWFSCGSGLGLTYPASEPVKRIDYLFVTPPVRCTGARVIDTPASDHRPVLIDLAMP